MISYGIPQPTWSGLASKASVGVGRLEEVFLFVARAGSRPLFLCAKLRTYRGLVVTVDLPGGRCIHAACASERWKRGIKTL